MGWTLTVTELNEYVRRSLAGDPILKDLSLRGEISGYKKATSGHMYFTLKDEQSRVNCALFRQNAMRLSFEPRDGLRVIVRGSAGLYTATGSYQFYAEDMKQDGVGELYLKFEELKNKLMREGLFDPARKKPLPLLPRAIGVVTSRTGAVIHDIETVTKRRYPGMQIILCPALVQGEGAAKEIASGILRLAQSGLTDVIIVGRGGGSMEDLWAFNEEIVVRAISMCPVPVISAVGHETDVTLADFAADVRAATPSAAAELAVPEYDALLDTLDEIAAGLMHALSRALLSRKAMLQALDKRLTARHPINQLHLSRARLDTASARLKVLTERLLAALRARLEASAASLNALGPKQALDRGYVIALSGGKPVTSVKEIKEHMTLILRDGRAVVRTQEIKEGDPFGEENDL